jgi:two-component system, NtrC family, sensor histidine kinase HydH
MTQQAYALIGLTALVAGLISVLVFAVLRFGAAARDTRKHLRDSGAEAALLSAALQEAVTRLRVQERAMTARAEASERLNTEIVASLTAGLLVVGLDGKVRILNPSGRRLLGTQEPLPGDGTYRAVLTAAAPLAEVVEECLTTARPIVRRAVQIPGARGTVHLGVTASPLLDEAGGASGAICLFTDLTAVVDLEEQLLLKDTLARLGELTAGLAHEFRNGLATVHGYARLVNMAALGDKDRQCVEGIRNETDALGRIVTNFLNFARPAQLAVSPVDLQTLAARAADDVRDEAVARGGSVEVSGEFPHIDGDEVLLRQAFSNLLRNALEACAGTNVAPRIVIEGRVDVAHRAVRVRISDNGPGVDAALRERIFRPFFTTRRDGTGLGLSLVQKIVVTHNGRVTVGSAPGGGAAFEVVLPLAS